MAVVAIFDFVVVRVETECANALESGVVIPSGVVGDDDLEATGVIGVGVEITLNVVADLTAVAVDEIVDVDGEMSHKGIFGVEVFDGLVLLDEGVGAGEIGVNHVFLAGAGDEDGVAG